MVTSAIVLVFVSNSAYSAMEDFSVSVGGMTWYNWYNPISRIHGMDVPKTSSAFMSGPTLKAQYKDLYFGVSYLLSSGDYELVVTDSPIRIHHADANSSASREDVDFVVGYMLTPLMSLNAGYKGIFVDDNLTLVSQGVAENAKRNETYNLGTLGVGVNVPLGLKFIWFLNGNALLGAYHNNVSYPAKYKHLNTADDNLTAWGASADTSIKYTIINNMSANIGLKSQYTKAGSDNSSFFGPTFGLDYRF
jgi:hypothetical protein